MAKARASSVAQSLLPLQVKNLRADQLRRLAFLCGVSTAGTKDILAARLHHIVRDARPEAKKEAKKSRETCLLSIDLGIKNLAYARLTAPAPDGSQAPSSWTSPLPVHVHAWERRDLTTAQTSPTMPVGVLAEEPADLFTPGALATAANRFVFAAVVGGRPRPTHVVLERQRFRTGGAAAVQEWTLRVNMLEAMLHASLRTLRLAEVWDGEVMSVNPGNVNALWLDGDRWVPGVKAVGGEVDEVAGEGKKGKETSQNIKRKKIDLLRGWLNSSDMETVIPTGEDTKLKLHDMSRSKGRMLNKEKLDDITDSLLQGMAWFRWEQNKATLCKQGGLEQLLNLPSTQI
ncbi:mitochondrial resolvase Ydc2 [Xylariaceae sp. FL0016]|nr:mitochondrial resolvase Ydc2 [Xylariaceae sp. FL0016]